MKDEQAFHIELKDIINAVKRRFYLVILIAVPILLLSIYYGNNSERVMYKSKASLIIGNYASGGDIRLDINDVTRIQTFIRTYCAIAKTSLVSEKVVKKLNLNISPEALSNCITASPQQDTQFMDLELMWADQNEVTSILDAFIEAYIQEAKRIYPAYNIMVMEKGNVPQMVAVSSKKLYIALGLLAGMIISLLFIFALEFFDNMLKTERDVEASLGLPVIGIVPKRKRKALKVDLDSMETLDADVIEAFRTLRTNIYFTSIDAQTIAVTSGVPGEGKTTAASILAVLMAQDGKKTVLIDCNLRKPDIHVSHLTETGLSDILTGGKDWTDVVHKSKLENLFVITSGPKPDNPAELLSLVRMKELMERLQDEFDYIILDTPAIDLVTDAQVLSQFADRYLLIVSCGESKREETIKSKKLIEFSGGIILGVILNKSTDSVFKRYYKKYLK